MECDFPNVRLSLTEDLYLGYTPVAIQSKAAGQTVATSCEHRITLMNITAAGSQGTRGTLASASWWFCGCREITASRNRVPVRPSIPHHKLTASGRTVVAMPTTDTQTRMPTKDSVTRRPVAGVESCTIGCTPVSVVATCWKQCQLLQTMIRTNIKISGTKNFFLVIHSSLHPSALPPILTSDNQDFTA